MEKMNLDFLKKMQTSVEPQIKPGESALEAIQRMEREKMDQIIREGAVRKQGLNEPPSTPRPNVTPTHQQPPATQEVVFYEGYKFNRDFFTCMSLCIMKLNDPDINKIFETFGFEMKDLNGKLVVLKKKKVRATPNKK